ncbi:hypothetical protein ABFS82_02G022600 [Erythranthe guttata]|uniref:BHLH domain-containing protein n=2 Tax=Erythranthe guttata TaxID=4155 RepID=A0A022RFX4_ERYGU|nr:hypothetical protein MIMGU_mgv1a007881mg [Erythranthe guttata]
MNRGGLPEMLHCLHAAASEGADISVLDRQRSRHKWQQDQLLIQQHHQQNQPLPYFSDNSDQLGGVFMSLNGDHGGLHELLLGGAMKPDPGLENGWGGDLVGGLNYASELEKNYAIQRTVSCPPDVAAAKIAAQEAALSSAAGRESSKKRKADKTQTLKVIAEEKTEEKKMKECFEEDSKITEQNSNNNNKSSTITTATNSKDNNNNSKEFPKTDYIHVRARRGQATDSHSLAERVRREKISERMKYLQDLVPGCDKITGKAGMLDEIINYVQSLQRQVEFLSMKLAVINPRLDFDVENYHTKQNFTGCSSSVPTIGTPSEMMDQSLLQFNSLGQEVSGSILEMLVNPMDVSLRRTISAPVSVPHPFLDSSSLNQQIQHVTWEDEFQNIYNME